MVFCDGMVAMASLNGCVTSKGSLAGSRSHQVNNNLISYKQGWTAMTADDSEKIVDKF